MLKFLTGLAPDGTLAMPEQAMQSGQYLLSLSSYDSSLWKVSLFD